MPSTRISQLSRRTRRAAKSAALGVGLTLSMGTALAFGGTAVASASYISSNTGVANVRTCGSTSCGVVRTLGNGTGVNMIAWCDSSWATGNYASPRWFKINWPVSGWVHSSLVAAQQSVGHNCYA